jgi:triacylglycerol esterase/lipase EstA (alpha/beta hydrolase family)
MPLWDRAKSVLLQLEVAGLGERPLVFVTHSMGGLLIKQLLGAANGNAAQAPWRAIIEKTRGVCFIATPHFGSDLAKWASYFQTFLGTNVSIEELRPHDPLLRQLNESYLNLVTR